VALLRREPERLADVEGAVGELRRDARAEVSSLVRRSPTEGVELLRLAFLGRALHEEANPRVAELRILLGKGSDVRATVTEVLGAGVEGGGDAVFFYGLREEPGYRAWKGTVGSFKVADAEPALLQWERAESLTNETADEDTVVARIVALLSRTVDRAALEETFGPLETDGRGPYLVGSSRYWRCVALPADTDALDDIQIELRGGIRPAPLTLALGWADIDEAPTMGGFRVGLRRDPTGLVRHLRLRRA